MVKVDDKIYRILKYEEILVYSGYKRNINDLFDTSLLCSELLVAGTIWIHCGYCNG